MKLFTLAALLAAGSWIAAGCSNDTTASSTTTPTPTATSPTTSTFASLLTVGGSASRTFTASAAGTVTVTLTNAAGPFNIVGLGIGIPNGGVSRCTLSTALNTTAGSTAQIAARVDAGTYCVAVYDVGTLPAAIDFSVTIVFP
jgi:hypothetical protein